MKRNLRLIALVLLVSMLTSIASCSKEEIEETTEEETTTTTTEETTEETTTAAPAPTATPTPRPSPTPAETTEETEEEEVDYDAYEVIMNGIDEIEATDPGNYLYQCGYSNRAWHLYTLRGDENSEYTIENGELELTDTSVVENPEYAQSFFTYDEMKMLPLLPSHLGSVRSGEFVSSIEDDTYFGIMLAVSEDGRYGLFYIGTPVEFDQSYVDSLQVGDEIGYEDIYVTDIRENGSNRWITLSRDDLFFSPQYYDFTGTQLLCSDSVNPVRENEVLVVLPISTSCTVTDTYYILTGTDNDGYTSWQTSDRTGVPFFDSYFWYYLNNPAYLHNVEVSSTGWYDFGYSLAYPVVVTNGEVTLMNLEWR